MDDPMKPRLVTPSPSRQPPAPVGIDVLSHLRLIVALAVFAMSVTLATHSQFVLIKFHSQARTVADSNTSVYDRDPAPGDHFVFFRLPRIMRVAGIAQMRRNRGGMRHGHQ